MIESGYRLVGFLDWASWPMAYYIDNENTQVIHQFPTNLAQFPAKKKGFYKISHDDGNIFNRLF